MHQPPPVTVVLSTCPPREAERIATALVSRRRAACVNVLPAVTSIYRWQGKLEREEESLLVIKCPSRGLQALLADLTELHPYEVPEAIAFQVTGGHRPYLDWVLQETAAQDPAPPPRPAEGEGETESDGEAPSHGAP